MSIDQTSQLIQLMLNSVLMMALCGGVALGLMVRQQAIASQLRLLKPLYLKPLSPPYSPPYSPCYTDPLNRARIPLPEQFWHLKAQLRRLRRQYRLLCFAGWSANSALMLCAGSTLLLALRTLILLNRLIPLSLLMFTAGVALLLLGIVLGLLSLVQANSLDVELKSEPEPTQKQRLPHELSPEFKAERHHLAAPEATLGSVELALWANSSRSQSALPPSINPLQPRSRQITQSSRPGFRPCTPSSRKRSAL